MLKGDLIKGFREAKELNSKYVGVLVSRSTDYTKDIFLNYGDNLEAKLKSYDISYDEELISKRYDFTKVLNVAYGETPTEVNKKLMEGLANDK